VPSPRSAHRPTAAPAHERAPLADRAAAPGARAPGRAREWRLGGSAAPAYRARCECQVFLQFCAGDPDGELPELTTGVPLYLRPAASATAWCSAPSRRCRTRSRSPLAPSARRRRRDPEPAPRGPIPRTRSACGAAGSRAVPPAHCKVLQTGRRAHATGCIARLYRIGCRSRERCGGDPAALRGRATVRFFYILLSANPL
jgi:hypothetical protein